MTGHEHHRRFGDIEIGGRPARTQYRDGNWDLGRYQTAVAAQLGMLQNSRTGSMVLNNISRRLLIVPFQDPDSENAVARPMGEAFLGYIPTSLPQQNRNATMYGQWVDPGRAADGVGTGRGSSVVIEYTPGMWVPGSAIATTNATPTRAQEMLLHELVHAIRQMRGLADTRQSIGAFANFDARDEFHAILVTNFYRSEKGISPLRRDHHGRQPLQNPSAFYAQPHNKLLVMDLCREMPPFTRALANLTCPFNPIREYYAEMGVVGA